MSKPGGAEELGGLFNSAGGDAQQIGGGDHADQGLFNPAAALQQPDGEVAAGAQLGNGEFDRAGPGVLLVRAVAVAQVDTLVADLPVFGISESVRRPRRT